MLCVIAGEGNLPIKIVERLQKDKRDFKLIYLDKKFISFFCRIIPDSIINILDFDSFAKFFEKENIKEVILCGSLKFPGFINILRNFYTLKKYFPDFTIERLRKATSGDDNLLKLVLDILEYRNLRIVPVHEILPEILVNKDDEFISEINNEKLENIKNNIEKGLNFLERMSNFDIGQGIVIELDSGRIIAIEGAEGTNKLLERCSEYSKEEKIFIKTTKINQDLRIDFPTIGKKTLEILSKNNFKTVATREKNLIILDREFIKEELKRRNVNFLVF